MGPKKGGGVKCIFQKKTIVFCFKNACYDFRILEDMLYFLGTKPDIRTLFIKDKQLETKIIPTDNQSQ